MKRYKVHLIPAVYHDLNEARDWYQRINPELPKKLNLQVKLAIEQIRSLPAHATRYNNVRLQISRYSLTPSILSLKRQISL